MSVWVKISLRSLAMCIGILPGMHWQSVVVVVGEDRS
jgi:hypothetical protein